MGCLFLGKSIYITINYTVVDKRKINSLIIGRFLRSHRSVKLVSEGLDFGKKDFRQKRSPRSRRQSGAWGVVFRKGRDYERR